VERDPVSGKVLLHFPGADLEIGVVDGKLEISSTCGIRIRSDRGVEIAGSDDSRLELDRKGVVLASPALDMRVRETDFVGERITARSERVKVVWGKLEQVVGHFVGFAKEVYQRIEGLVHTRAGRIRTEAGRAYLLQADRARIQATGDVRVQGRTINLG